MGNIQGLRIERVHLRVSDADRAQRYWSTLTATEARDGSLLDTEARPMVVFRDDGISGDAPPRAAGLFHVALRFGTRAALGSALRRIAGAGVKLTGASDHGVSEALYLRDPDGLGVELYWDRPRDQWPQHMFTAPLDLQPILDAADGDDGVAPVDIGHVHLQASNLDDSTRFWRHQIGLDVQEAWPGAAFLSADDYHHHIGLNTWNSAGSPPALEDRPGLSRITLSARGRGDGVELDTPEGLLVAVVPSG
jgi:catechol 2,3-dioxygenase